MVKGPASPGTTNGTYDAKRSDETMGVPSGIY
jgi:hypothetical protein